MSINVKYEGEEREELKQIVLEMRSNGKYLSEVADETGVSDKTVKVMEEELINEKRLTRKKIDDAILARKEMEKRQDDKPEKVRIGVAVEGKTKQKVAEELEISEATVRKIVKQLIEGGKTTEQEIKEARDRRKELEYNELKNKIKYCLAVEGKTKRETGYDLGIAIKTINKIEQDLLDSGEITEQEIKDARERKKQEKNVSEKEKTLVKPDIDIRNLENLLRLGIEKKRIKSILEIDSMVLLDEAIQSVIDKDIITIAEIEEVRKNRIREDRETVYRMRKEGKSCNQIAYTIPYGDRLYIGRIERNLIQEGLLTKDEIKDRKEEINNERKMFIYNELKNGNEYQRIIENGNEKGINLNFANIDYTRIKLIEDGLITEEEIEEARKVRKENEKKNNPNTYIGPYDEKIKKLILLRFSCREIGEMLTIYWETILNRKKALIERGELPSDIPVGTPKSRLKWEKNTRDTLNEMCSYVREVDVGLISEYMEYAKAKVLLEGYKASDIHVLSKAIQFDTSLITPANINYLITRIYKEL